MAGPTGADSQVLVHRCQRVAADSSSVSSTIFPGAYGDTQSRPVSMIAITESPTPISPADRSLARTPLRISAILRTGIVNSTGKGSTFTQSFPLLQTVHTRLNSLGFYVQDEWKIRRNLNLTYGVPFEPQGNPSCKEGCYSRPNTTFLGPGYQAGLRFLTTRHCKQGCIMTSRILKAL